MLEEKELMIYDWWQLMPKTIQQTVRFNVTPNRLYET
jgi:hypothetical protein